MRLPTAREERMRKLEQKAKAIGAGAGALKLIEAAKRHANPDDKEYVHGSACR